MTAAAGSAHQAELRGLLASTPLGEILLPTSAVAEVVAYTGDASRRDGEPDWLVGSFGWRDRQVPLVDVAGQAGATADAAAERHRRPHVLVCFTPNANQTMPYVGFMVTGLPRLIRIHADDLAPAAEPPEGQPFLLCALEFQGRPAWIPDLDEVERQGLRLALPPR